MDHRQYASITECPPCTEVRPRQGLVTVFTGDGRGKTTAAMGTALRAAGHGLRVLVVLFMKGPDFIPGELSALRTMPHVTVQQFGAPGWVMPGGDYTAHQHKANEALAYCAREISSGNYDVAILDEAVSAVALGLIPPDVITKLITTRPEGLELILTGRGASSKLIELADLVTEMKSIKHPFERGITARAGIDY